MFGLEMPVGRCLLLLCRKFELFVAVMKADMLINLRKLSPKCVKIARPTLFGYIETREELEYYVNELFNLLKSGQLKVKIHKTYPLEQVAQAHRDLEGRKTIGKLLLKHE